MRNVISTLKNKVTAKNVALATAVATAAPVTAFCDADTTLRNTLKLVFNLMKFGGIVFCGYGVVLIAKAIASPDAGDPHGITKGIGAIVGGVIMIVVKSVLSVMGINIDNFSLNGTLD